MPQSPRFLELKPAPSKHGYALALTALLMGGVLAPAHAQQHSRSELVRGQDANFSLVNAGPQSAVLFGFSASGLGRGTCFPQPIGFCLDMLEPVFYFPPLVANTSGEADASFVVPAMAPLVPIQSQAITIRLAGNGFVFAKSNAVNAPIRSLSSLSDSFAGSSLDGSWLVHNPQLVNIQVSGGELHLEPTQSGPPVTWFADAEGPMVYKLVRGDFDFRTRVRSYDSASPMNPPPLSYRMGGITIRDPASRPGQRNWLHIAVGGGTSRVPIAVEDKTTALSRSDLQLSPLSAPRAEIRALRQGARISFFVRESSAAPWRALRSHVRNDLGPVLQVGLNVFSWTSPVRVRASFESADFVGL